MRISNKTRGKTLITLFLSTLYISACTFGGGFVIVTFMKRRFVDELGWINEQEMLDMVALAQSAPGAIAVNAAILVGWRMGGFAGMLVAVAGTVLPPMVILSVISLFYKAFASNPFVSLALKGMRAGVAAVILSVVCELGTAVLKQRSLLVVFVMLAAFAATSLLHVNVVAVLLAAVFIGVVAALLQRGKENAHD